ncbi:hypothetical protein [Photobacterium sp. Hal280]
MMVTLAGFTSTESLIKQIIATALDMIIQVSRLPNGKRVITHIVEVQDVADDQIRIQELYQYNQQTEDFLPVDAMSAHLRKKLEEGL